MACSATLGAAFQVWLSTSVSTPSGARGPCISGEAMIIPLRDSIASAHASRNPTSS